MGSLDAGAARSDEWPLACRLALGHSPPGELESRAERLHAILVRGEFDPSGLILARREDVPVGAIAVQVLPGGTGVLMPPFAPDPEALDALVDAAVQHCRRADAALVHCCLDDADPAPAAPLLRAGFEHVTRLAHMLRRGSIIPAVAPIRPSDLNFIPYSNALEASFGETLLRTYIGSLDLPEATVDRPTSQLLAGYRHGQPDPPRWWLVEGPAGDAVGVVILDGLPSSEAVDVAYLGIVHEQRRKGYGRALIGHAFAESQRIGTADIGLSVDARNAPAIDLYRDCQFRMYRSQELYLMRLRSTR